MGSCPGWIGCQVCHHFVGFDWILSRDLQIHYRRVYRHRWEILACHLQIHRNCDLALSLGGSSEHLGCLVAGHSVFICCCRNRRRRPTSHRCSCHRLLLCLRMLLERLGCSGPCPTLEGSCCLLVVLIRQAWPSVRLGPCLGLELAHLCLPLLRHLLLVYFQQLLCHPRWTHHPMRQNNHQGRNRLPWLSWPLLHLCSWWHLPLSLQVLRLIS